MQDARDQPLACARLPLEQDGGDQWAAERVEGSYVADLRP
jgi:hypothetical protein